MSSRVFLLLIGLIFFGGYYYWNGHTKKSEIFVKHSSKSSGEQSISLMTFNVENFYDIENDPQKNDDTFLPIHLKKNRKHKEQCQKIRRKKWREECLFLDWSSAKFKDKARKIAQVIEQANPDIVVLQEVENLFALNKIQGSFEKIEVFPTQVLIEGRDYRGIDIALLARFPVGDMGLGLNYADLGKKMVDVRGILTVPLKISKNQLLYVLGVHFPAPFHPYFSRKKSWEKVNELVSRIQKKFDSPVVVLGDLNITSKERQEENWDQVWKQEKWSAAHEMRSIKSKGTAYYAPKRRWSFLDRIFLREGNKWKLVPGSAKVINSLSFQKDQYGRPARYQSSGDGFSDHWPLFAEIQEVSH